MFQVDLELHLEFCMANQDKQPNSSNTKVKALQKIIEKLVKKLAIAEAEKAKGKVA